MVFGLNRLPTFTKLCRDVCVVCLTQHRRTDPTVRITVLLGRIWDARCGCPCLFALSLFSGLRFPWCTIAHTAFSLSNCAAYCSGDSPSRLASATCVCVK